MCTYSKDDICFVLNFACAGGKAARRKAHNGSTLQKLYHTVVNSNVFIILV
jgi:hypothetical protein